MHFYFVTCIGNIDLSFHQQKYTLSLIPNSGEKKSVHQHVSTLCEAKTSVKTTRPISFKWSQNLYRYTCNRCTVCTKCCFLDKRNLATGSTFSNLLVLHCYLGTFSGCVHLLLSVSSQFGVEVHLNHYNGLVMMLMRTKEIGYCFRLG